MIVQDIPLRDSHTIYAVQYKFDVDPNVGLHHHPPLATIPRGTAVAIAVRCYSLCLCLSGSQGPADDIETEQFLHPQRELAYRRLLYVDMV